MAARTLPQNRKLGAIVSDVWRIYPLVPLRPTLAREAWKRFMIQTYVREARLEAYANGQPDPFPVRPVPSSSLDERQMSELLECSIAFAAQNLNLILN